MWASERGHYNIVKAMIEHKVDVTTQDKQEVTGRQLALPLAHWCIQRNLLPSGVLLSSLHVCDSNSLN